MISIPIPGGIPLKLHHLVLDYNGTIAKDGEPIAEAVDRIVNIADLLDIHVVTADTHGTVAGKIDELPVKLFIIGDQDQDLAKKTFVEDLGSDITAAIGNGRNDSLMLRQAALGIGVIQAEGASTAIMGAADIVCTQISNALDLLLFPDRLRATLRN
jgi:soluble P-type ATPase